MDDPTDNAAPFRRAPDRVIDVASGEVALRSSGSGPDVLFIHGWPVSGATFRHLLPHLADHVTCHVIDLPGAGSSSAGTIVRPSVAGHIDAVRRVVDTLGVERIAVVGHDSGGLIARHAMVGDPRLSAMGLIDTEPSSDLSWKFRSFIAGRRIPGFGTALGFLAGRQRLRRSRLVFGDAFADRSLLDGDFDEFFLRPLHESSGRRAAAMDVLKSFDLGLVRQLGAIHRRIDVPVVMVWGEHDRFFPVGRIRPMADEFPDGRLEIVEGAGLFSHEERPEAVARALLPTLLDSR